MEGLMSLRLIVEQRVKEVFAKIGIPEEYARVAYGPLHPLYKGKVNGMSKKPKPTRKPRPKPGY
jgi:hypothetical protein